MRRKSSNPERRQIVTDELVGKCLAFLQNKFYQGKDRAFSKDRKRLLDWVVLWPATWLDERAVTISLDEYYKIFMTVFMDSVRFGDLENIEYAPAWLAQVIQSHFGIHGEDYYQAAKSVRTLTENALLFAKKNPATVQPDPIRELASARRLLRPKKLNRKIERKEQLKLL
jgi:hypothetical protein